MNSSIPGALVILAACSVLTRTRESESERTAAAALEACGSIVKVDETKPGKPVVVVHLRSNTGSIMDNDQVHLNAFPNLRRVEPLNKRFNTDAGLAHLAGLDQLEELDLGGTNLTAAGLIRFVSGRTRLQRLNLTGIPLGDDDLAHLKRLINQRSLSPRESWVTDRGLSHLKSSIKLRDLSLMSTRVGDAGLKHLQELTELEELDLDATTITDAGLEHLRTSRRLQRLQVACTTVTDASLEHLQTLSRPSSPLKKSFGPKPALFARSLRRRISSGSSDIACDAAPRSERKLFGFERQSTYSTNC